MSETTPTEATKQNVEILFDISASAARIAASCRARHDIRYYLNGIKVEQNPDGGVFVVGTNGHILGVCSDATGKAAASVIVSITKELGKALPVRYPLDTATTRLRLVKIGDLIQLHLTDEENKVFGIFPSEIIDAKFPIWRAVIPDISALSPMVDPVHLPYLSFPKKALADGLAYCQAQFYQSAANSAVAMFLPDHKDTLFVLMPQRPIDKDGLIVSGWSHTWMAQREIGLKLKARANEKVSPDAIQHTEDPDHAEEEMAGV